MAIDWTFEIDFDRSNTWTNIIDRVRGTIKWSWGVDPYNHIWKDEQIVVTLYNKDRAFSPENSSSPYAGKMLPGRPCRLKADGVVQFLGLIEDWQASPQLYADNTTKLIVRTLKIDLDRTTYQARLWENMRADQIIAELIPMIKLPPTVYGVFRLGHPTDGALDDLPFITQSQFMTVNNTGAVTFAYAGDNLQGAANNDDSTNQLDDRIIRNRARTSVYGLMRDLMEAERGQLYIGKDGKFIFNSRYTWANRLAIDYTINNDSTGPLKYDSGYQALIDRVNVTYQPRLVNLSYDNILWQLAAPIVISANQSITLNCTYTDSQGGRFIQHPTGNDFVYTGGTVSIGIVESAQQATVTLTNLSTTDATVSALILRGQSIKSVNPGVVTASNPNIGFDLGIYKPLELNIKAIDNYADALAIAEWELRKRGFYSPRVITVTLASVPSALTDRQLEAEVGDRVRVIDTQVSHDDQYHIAKITHSLDSEHKKLTTVWHLELAAIPKRLTDDAGDLLLDDNNDELYEDII